MSFAVGLGMFFPSFPGWDNRTTDVDLPPTQRDTVVSSPGRTWERHDPMGGLLAEMEEAANPDVGNERPHPDTHHADLTLPKPPWLCEISGFKWL